MRAFYRAAWLAEQQQRTTVQNDKPTEKQVWQQLAVQEVHDDYLVCKLVANGATYGSNINVAKDPGLRKSRYHGRTLSGLLYNYTGAQARTVTKPSDPPTADDPSRDQVIIPKYFVPSDETNLPVGELAFTGTIITAVASAVYVEDDDGGPLHCQYLEITQRAYAIDEEAS